MTVEKQTAAPSAEPESLILALGRHIHPLNQQSRELDELLLHGKAEDFTRVGAKGGATVEAWKKIVDEAIISTEKVILAIRPSTPVEVCVQLMVVLSRLHDVTEANAEEERHRAHRDCARAITSVIDVVQDSPRSWIDLRPYGSESYILADPYYVGVRFDVQV